MRLPPSQPDASARDTSEFWRIQRQRFRHNALIDSDRLRRSMIAVSSPRSKSPRLVRLRSRPRT
ncbi:DUF1589 domain-containing protein [Rhodopirellula bahusiensis]|uniref:DUF1589 domain-containing protein n=1 Tax=Rhodopirellula bahusiensis TaxID=2014065 RepID=UPI003D65BC65